MAKKKASKARSSTVASLKPHLARSLKEAKALRGKVANDADLQDLIDHLETLQASASSNCPVSTWARKFALGAVPATKASKKTSKGSSRKK
jgi:hypothetical protein